jgi:hypothetical protein
MTKRVSLTTVKPMDTKIWKMHQTAMHEGNVQCRAKWVYKPIEALYNLPRYMDTIEKHAAFEKKRNGSMDGFR